MDEIIVKVTCGGARLEFHNGKGWDFLWKSDKMKHFQFKIWRVVEILLQNRILLEKTTSKSDFFHKISIPKSDF